MIFRLTALCLLVFATCLRAHAQDAANEDAEKTSDTPTATEAATSENTSSPLKSDKQRTSYAIGVSIGRGLDRDAADVSTVPDLPEFKIEEHGVRIADRFIDLTRREHALLEALIRRQGQVMSRDELIEEAWEGEVLPKSRNVDAHVKTLRRKLGLSPNPIETVRGVGYRFAWQLARGRSQASSM